MPRAPYAQRFTETAMSRFVEYGDKLAVVDGITEESRTFTDLTKDVEAVARSFRSMGIGPGDVVGLYTPNHVDFFAAFHGAVKVGAVVTLLNPLYTKHEITTQLQGSKAKALIAHSSCFEAATLAAKDLPLLEHLVQVGDTAPTGAVALDDLKKWPTNLERGTIVPPTPVGGDDIACLPYSSGTTGLPKGTMLTHDNLTVNLMQCSAVDGKFWTPEDVLISPLPFFHIYAFMYSVHQAAYLGNTLVTMPRFDMDRFCALVEQYKCTRAHLVPPIVLGLAKTPIVDQHDLSSLKVLTCAAAPLGGELEAEASERLDVIIKQAWGMSELSPLGTCVPDDAIKPESGTVGPPCAATSAKVIDLESGVALPIGEEGELCIRGPQCMKGYLDQPEKTAECLDEDGWLMTGDIAKMDEDGYVYITDRLKELIKYKGFQVAPAELEEVVCLHDEVEDCTVIPVIDEDAGELPRAYVVKKDSSDIQEQALLDWVAERVAPHKKLRGGIIFTESIPKTASGKILRREVVDMDRELHGGK
jgi:acyl-CoA synthetase (AMP-forming)/AMP-acid ligase II